MAKSKRLRALREKIEPGKLYGVDEALEMLKSMSKVKFTESVDVSIRLGVDPRKSDQVVRGSIVMPNGTGKSVRVAVFAQGENAEKATAAGADIVGFEDLAETIKGGTIDFDVCIATPDAMRVVGRLGTVLGPRGLMPNPKVGTVTQDVATAVQNAKAGQVQFRTDKGGIIHATIGKADFEVEELKGNLKALVGELVKIKPPAAKGHYLRKMSLSTTMGPGITVDGSSL
ncbi:MAG: 50S ribosomal protein L1 [Wenzhouxiangella sp.]|jgi:large subunit ribosomal protein L1|nr:50S ribosomal protein L1 [Wenzhouxiangella sp.]